MRSNDEDYFNTLIGFLRELENVEKALKACEIHGNRTIFFEERRLIMNIYESSLFKEDIDDRIDE
jgi:hypothetical protein